LFLLCAILEDGDKGREGGVVNSGNPHHLAGQFSSSDVFPPRQKVTSNQNMPTAHFQQSVRLAEGRRVRVDLIQSAKYMKMAADQNLAHTQYNCSVCPSPDRSTC
jgi:TPR repeat protein